MNSYCNDDKDCGHKTPKKAEVLLKCKPSYPKTVTATTSINSTEIARIYLNTTKFSFPCFKVEFSTNLITTLENGAVGAIVNFQLFKVCGSETVPTAIGDEWVFTSSEGSNSAAIITFIVCDCDCDCEKDDCCTYYVEASYIAADMEGNTATLTFNNPSLSVSVVEKIFRC